MKPNPVIDALRKLKRGEKAIIGAAPEGMDVLLVADAARALTGQAGERSVVLVHVARDGQRMAALEAGLQFVAPDIDRLIFPAWDCQPYDRVGPAASIVAQRMTTLARLATMRTGEKPRILLTTVNAILQRVAARARMDAESLAVAPGNAVAMERIIAWLEAHGFSRTATVRDVGEYAVRGGILDLYPAGQPAPLRFDFFGDTLEIDPHLRCRDAAHGWPVARPRNCPHVGSGAHHGIHQAISPELSCRIWSGDEKAIPCMKRSARGGAIRGRSTGCRCSCHRSIHCSIILVMHLS